MRYAVHLLCVMLSSIVCHGQNLVSNPGFESYSVCPSSTAQLNRCIGWGDYNNASADYFNACNTGTVGVPSNQFGYEALAAGTGYAGLQDFSSIDYKEYLTANISPMTAGTTYEVSMLVSLADNSKYASNGLGVYFFKNAPSSVSSTTVLPVTPQISYKSLGPITNKIGWRKLTQRFTADSAYDHIVIGGFLDNAAVTSAIQPTGVYSYSYYYIDSVVVKYADSISIDVTGKDFCVGSNMLVNYTINNAVQYNQGNIFTVQLSSSTGSFASPITIGSIAARTSGSIMASIPNGLLSGGGYRVRVTSSNPSYTSSDNGFDIGIGSAAPIPTVHITSPVCQGDTARLSVTSSNNITNAKWSGPGFNNTDAASIVLFHTDVANAGYYTVEAYNYGCKAAPVGGMLVVNQGPVKPLASSNSPLCSGDTLKLSGTTTGVSNTWVHNGSSYNSASVSIPNADAADAGVYILSTWLNGCAARDSAYVIVKPSPRPSPVASHPCVGDTLVLSTSFISPFAVYSWKGPDSYTSSLPISRIVNVNVNASGTYHLSITDTNGCSAEDSIEADVRLRPPHTVIEGKKTYCEGEQMELTAQNTMPAISFDWSGPGNFSAAGKSVRIPDLTKNKGGTYSLVTTLNGCAIADTASIVVKPTPQVPDVSVNTPIYAGQDLEMKVNNIETGVNYSWSGPDDFQATGSSVSISKAGTEMSGSYNISAEMDGCLSSNIFLIRIDSQDDTSELVVYPNPSDGDFIIKGTVKSDQEISIVLTNDRGQLVYKTIVQTANKLLLLPVKLHGALADGVYFIKLYISGKRSIIPIVIKNRH